MFSWHLKSFSFFSFISFTGCYIGQNHTDCKSSNFSEFGEAEINPDRHFGKCSLMATSVTKGGTQKLPKYFKIVET
jgi:hypothetical protein